MPRQHYPVRLQLSRQKGFDLQRLSHDTNGLKAVRVDRSTWFGNPFKPGEAPDQYRCRAWLAFNETVPLPPQIQVEKVTDTAHAVSLFQQMIDLADFDLKKVIREELKGRNLACWCARTAPCHAGVLISIANGMGR